MAQKAVGVRLPPSAPFISLLLGMPSNKNILLINPWIYDFTAYDFWVKPLGLLYMAALLAKNTNFTLEYIDCLDRHHPAFDNRLGTKKDGRGRFFKEEVSKPRVLASIPRKFSRYGMPLSIFKSELDRIEAPDLVLVTCTMTYWYPGVQAVVEHVRQKFGSVPILLGGVYPSLLPQHALVQTGVDRVCQGPGENKIFSLINELLGDGTCPDIRDHTLEKMPHPAFFLLRDKSSLPLLTSRGCPMQCSFCASSLLFDKFEQRSPASVVHELEVASNLYGTKNIAIYDDALFLNKQDHIIPILKDIIEKKLALCFHTPNGLHVGEIDHRLASLLSQAGFRSLYLSQETFEEDLIEKSCPKISSDDLGKALDNLERAGYERGRINVYLIVGLPDQGFTGIRESILTVQNLGAKARLSYYSPIPGTADWEKIVSRGWLDEDSDPLLHNKLVFPYVWGNITPDEFVSLKKASLS
jgi:radical SAM superfamily enzyme YgiQ (UPF0313 family)